MKLERLKTLIADYSGVALGTYMAIFALVFAGFALAISFGLNVDSAKGGVGVVVGAYLATKVTQPLRIGATLLLTPVVARILKKAPSSRETATPPGDDLTSPRQEAASDRKDPN